MVRYWLFGLLALLWCCSPVEAQRYITVTACGTLGVPAPVPGTAPIVTVDVNGYLCSSAVGGGGGGDATAANQTLQITQATATNTVLGTVAANPTANTIADRLKVINTTLGSPFQAGGSIGNTTFAVTNAGTFAAQLTGATNNINNIAGTISLPTLAATSTKQSDGTQKSQIVDGSGNVIASTSNNLNVQCANCSGSGVSTADEASFTAGTSLFVGSGGFFQTTATSNALTNGQQGMQQMTAQRAGFVNLRAVGGTEVGTTAAPLQVGAPSGAFAAGAQVDVLTMRGTKNAGTAAANSLLAGGVFNSTPLTLTDTQQASLQVDANGYIKTFITNANTNGQATMANSAPVAIASNQSSIPVAATLSAETTKVIGTVNQGTSPWIAAGGGTAGTAATGVVTVQGIASMTKLLVTPDSVALPANQSVNVAQWGSTNIVNGGTAGIVGIGGSTATNVALTDNPINTGFQAISSQNAAVTTARKVQGVADLSGRQIITPYANPENWVQGTTAAMTGTTSTSLLAAPGAGLRNYAWVSCVNSHATVGTFVTIQDGSGGTALATVAAAAVFGGQISAAPIPIRQPTTATALFVANVTTGANVICSATGYTSTL